MSLGLTAMRDSEVAAESQGIDVAATKFWVYAASAFGSGMAAALYFLMNLRISPDAAFGVNWSAYLIFIVVIGGIGTIEGPIVGTLLFFLLRELLADYGAWYLIVIGLVAVVTMIACPMGLWATWRGASTSTSFRCNAAFTCRPQHRRLLAHATPPLHVVARW
jgi:branched-chain amino acid transport system permease protein